MNARNLLYGASYGPLALQTITQAFDRAWAEIAGHYDGDPAMMGRARLRLAYAILAIAPENASDVDDLKGTVLQEMALNRSSQGPGSLTSN